MNNRIISSSLESVERGRAGTGESMGSISYFDILLPASGILFPKRETMVQPTTIIMVPIQSYFVIPVPKNILANIILKTSPVATIYNVFVGERVRKRGEGEDKTYNQEEPRGAE